MVLTGGGSQLAGLGEFAADFFARPVRIARVEPLDGMPAAFCSPAFSTSIGLLQARTTLAGRAGIGRSRKGPATCGVWDSGSGKILRG